MIRQTYLLIDLLSVMVPLLASFHPASKLYKRWFALLPAIVFTLAIYCAWDAWFTRMGVWGFNPHYILGLYLWNLPLEEILFFICIPYACVFTFDCAAKLIIDKKPTKTLKIFNAALSVIFIGFVVAYRNNWYTAAAFAVPALLIICTTLKGVTWMIRFYLVYAVLLVPFLIVNGLLTGTGLASPIVWYNGAEIIGLRILTIPFEDIFYGMGLIMLNVWIYQSLLDKNYKITPLPQEK